MGTPSTCQKHILYLNLSPGWAIQKWSKFIIFRFVFLSEYCLINGDFKKLVLSTNLDEYSTLHFYHLVFSFLASWRGFSTLALFTFGVRKRFAGGLGRCPVLCRVSISLPGRYLLDASNIFWGMTTKNVSSHCQMFPGGGAKITPV